jgi:hypothetical protein
MARSELIAMDFDRMSSRMRREHGQRGYDAAGQTAD